MAAISVTRGSTVRFGVVFYNLNNQIVQPPSARISIDSVFGKGRKTASYDLTYDIALSQWTYSLNTRGMHPGIVTWSVSSTGDVPLYTGDGEFTLVANDANLGAVL